MSIQQEARLKVLIVDDEQLARQRLARMLADLPTYQWVGEAAHGAEAVARCAELVPDIVLLDIRMPGMDGLEAASHLQQLPTPPAVVFCTAYQEHAIAAFGVQAVGYLLKPVRKADLAQALANARRTNKAQLTALAAVAGSRRQHIAARTHKGISLIPVSAVRYFQADQKYVSLHHAAGEVLIDESLKELEAEFGTWLLRVHRSTLVVAEQVEALLRDAAGGYALQLRDIAAPVPVSRRHLPAVRRYLRPTGGRPVVE